MPGLGAGLGGEGRQVDVRQIQRPTCRGWKIEAGQVHASRPGQVHLHLAGVDLKAAES